MANNQKYFFMELYNVDKNINTYTVPNETFFLDDQNNLITLLNDFFICMINDLTYVKNPEDISDWNTVKFYLLDEEIKSLEIIKTKNEMDQYPSYGEGVLLVYNQIINNN
jgi:hypothetical protein